MAAVCFCPSANKSGNEEFITNFVYLERWMSCLPFVIHFQEDLPVNTKEKIFAANVNRVARLQIH